MEVDESLVWRLLAGLRECSRHVERGVAGHPLDEIDVGVLALAEQANGTLRPSQATEALDLAFPSVTRHVQGLQRTGYVAIEPDPDDRRSYRIVLTDEGAAMLRDFRSDLVARFAPVIEGWDSTQLATLADGLTKLAAAMHDARAAAGRRRTRPPWWRAQALGGLQ
jgi:DNA-binding MarR family transcriptional regulator